MIKHTRATRGGKTLVRRVTLSSAEFKGMYSAGSPVEIVPGPGISRYLHFQRVVAFFKAGSDAATDPISETADNLTFRVGATTVSTVHDVTGFIDATADRIGFFLPATTEPIFSKANIVNKPMYALTTGNGWTGNAAGDAELSLAIFYRIVEFGGGEV